MKKYSLTKMTANRIIRASMLDDSMLNVESLERDMQGFIGKNAKRAKQFLKDLGFECTLIAGPSKTNADYWEEYTTNGDEPGSIMVKLYFPLVKSGNRWTDGELEDFYVDSYEDVYSSTASRGRRRITASSEDQYEDLAMQLGEAIQKLAADEDHLNNFISYLTHSFPEWLRTYANTPEGLVSEFHEFANMRF